MVPKCCGFSLPSSMGVGWSAGHLDASTPEQAGLPPRLEGGRLSLPKHLENTALFGLEAVVGAGWESALPVRHLPSLVASIFSASPGSSWRNRLVIRVFIFRLFPMSGKAEC